MKKASMILAALAAFQAAAITATKEYVDRRDTEIRTNTYTRAETDARIAELAPRTSLAPATNYTDEAVAAVSNAVAQKADLTRVVASVMTYLIPNMIASGDWAQGVAGNVYDLDYNATSTEADTSGKIWWSGSITDSFDPGDGMRTVYTWATAYYSIGDDTMGAFLWRDAPSQLPADVHNLIDGYDRSFIFYNNYDNPNGWLDVFSRIGSGVDDITVYDPNYGDTYWSSFSGTNYAEKVTTHTEGAVYSGSLDSATNDLHKGLAPTISNTVTKAFVENLGIESGIQEETDPVWTAEKGGYATKSELQAVSNESAIVTRLYTGSNVVDEVTNYNSAVNMPTRRMYQLNESNEYVKVWDENTRHTNTLALAKSYADEIGTNYAPRAWGRTTSGYGAEAPEGTTWLSSPTTVIAGGYEYEKHATAGGAIWLLTSKGAAFDFSPSTNNTAYLNIAAQDGTPIVRIEKTDSYLVGVAADAVSTDGPSTLVIGFDVVAASTPLVRVCTNLSDHVWLKQEDGIPAGYATVEWSGTSGDYECRITNNTGGNSLFAYFEYLQEGGVKIVNGGATDISGGIIVNGVHYSTIGTATIDGHTVLTLGN